MNQCDRGLSMTEELMVNMLGVRREGVTEAAGQLQKAGLIHYHRGRITVLDRPGLENRVCGCVLSMKRCGQVSSTTRAQKPPAALCSSLNWCSVTAFISTPRACRCGSIFSPLAVAVSR